jgi:HEAT repeat protein
VRLNAVVALARISPREESHVVAIARFLKAPEASLRIAAVHALGELGARARSAIPELQQLARDDDDASVIREVITALENIEADLAKPVGE